MKTRATINALGFSLALATLSMVSCAPAMAYWGYSPYTGASNWLWLARTLQYPFNRYSAVNAPYYLANTLITPVTYAASRKLGAAQRNMYYGDYQPGEQNFDPRPRLKSYGVSPDQLAYTGPTQAGVTAPNGAPLPVSAPPLAAGQPMQPQFAYPPSSSPMAKGFIDVVNQQYGGDISKALFDPHTRSYAKAVGLISSDDMFDADFTSEKVELIRKILADDNEDAATRLTTIRLLIKH